MAVIERKYILGIPVPFMATLLNPDRPPIRVFNLRQTKGFEGEGLTSYTLRVIAKDTIELTNPAGSLELTGKAINSAKIETDSGHRIRYRR